VIAAHNFGIQEHMPHAPETDRVFPHLDTDENLAAKFPHDPAYLPAARNLDGTVHSW
jgi:mannonate dehydratase